MVTSRTSRDLPIPGSPESSTTWLRHRAPAASGAAAARPLITADERRQPLRSDVPRSAPRSCPRDTAAASASPARTARSASSSCALTAAKIGEHTIAQVLGDVLLRTARTTAAVAQVELHDLRAGPPDRAWSPVRSNPPGQGTSRSAGGAPPRGRRFRATARLPQMPIRSGAREGPRIGKSSERSQIGRALADRGPTRISAADRRPFQQVRPRSGARERPGSENPATLAAGRR